MSVHLLSVFFFFQAEDGIRDDLVTGVQTCALPISDLNMPMLNGFDASEQLKSANPNIKIIVLTMNEDAEIAAETLRTWASGFLLKKSAGSELVKAVREVLHGGKYITPALQEILGELAARE